MRIWPSILAVVLMLPVAADEPESGGQLNPPEMGIARVMDNIGRGELDMMTCASGYYLTKKGDHDRARAVFETCANSGIPGAMTWMSQLDNNGLGGPYDPEASAEWDRRAAATGNRVGLFNHGLNLLRGHGVERNEALGRQFVDRAAADGLESARRLQQADYDPDEVTPDADEWKYRRELF